MKHTAPVLRLIAAMQLWLFAQYEIPTDIRAPGGSTVKRTGPRDGPTTDPTNVAYEVTIDDPAIFERPWVEQWSMQLKPA